MTLFNQLWVRLKALSRVVQKNLKIKMSRCWLVHIFVLYFIFSVILTYPLIFLHDGLVGPKGDNLQSYWNAWHFNKSIFNTNETLFFTKDLFYPSGTSLLLHTLSPLNLSLEFLFSRFFSLSYSYNLAIFLSFPLSAYFTFLLCLYFTKNKSASFVGGMIFAFSPYHVAHALRHLNLTGIYFFPLLALFFFKLKDTPSKKYTLLLSLVLFLTAFTDYYYLMYSFAFLFLGLIYFNFFSKETDKRFLRHVIYSIIIAILILSPLIVSTLLELKNNTYYTGGYNDYVLDTFSFITPPPWHPVLGEVTKKIYSHFTGNLHESTGYLGFVVLFLFIFGWIKNKERKKDKYFLILLFFIAIILSLGPTLHILGRYSVSLEHPLIQSLRIDKILNFVVYHHKHIGIPLPYYFLLKIPFFNISRNANRWIILGYLSLSILAAFGLKELLQKFSNKAKIVLFLLILGLIIFEYLFAIPLKYTKMEVPPFYCIIANDNSNYAIFDIPCGGYGAGNEFMYLQTIHHKKLLFATLSRTSKDMYTFLHSTGLFEFCHLNNSTLLYKDVLKEHRIKYIILHKEYLKEEEFLSLKYRLIYNFNHPFEDNKISVYKVY